MILHKCSFGYPLPRLFEYVRSVEKHGCQGAEIIFLICALLKLQKSSCPKVLARFENYFAQMLLWEPSTKVVQISRSVKKHGRQGAELISLICAFQARYEDPSNGDRELKIYVCVSMWLVQI